MICVIALIVFAIMAIFSAAYRPLAVEAFDCVFRKVTFRKCNSGLDKRVKGQIIGKVMKKAPKTGRFLYKRFEILSWIFVIITVLSLIQSSISLYNIAVYDNCNGEEGGACPLNLEPLPEGGCGAPECVDPSCNGSCEACLCDDECLDNNLSKINS